MQANRKLNKLHKVPCLALFGEMVPGKKKIGTKPLEQPLSFHDIRHNFNAAVSHKDKYCAGRRTKNSLLLEYCVAWTETMENKTMSTESKRKSLGSSRKKSKSTHAEGRIPIGERPTHVKVTTVVVEENQKEALSNEEIQEALMTLPKRLEEITDGKPVDMAFGITSNWSQEEEDADSTMNIGDTPLEGGE